MNPFGPSTLLRADGEPIEPQSRTIGKLGVHPERPSTKAQGSPEFIEGRLKGVEGCS